MSPDNRFVSERFPRSTQYHPEWVLASASGGANYLWLNEWLAPALVLRPGMRVLDLGYRWPWDTHNNIRPSLPAVAKATDTPAAALVKDLEQRGLLDTTIVHWGGEIG